jgi:hypothetical protein
MFEKEAKEYENEYWNSLVDSDDKEMLGEAFKDGAEFGYNKVKKEFEALIEKIKCCGNCKFQEIEEYTGCPICNIPDCNHKSKWELKEND